jgi:hypothetical protein
MYHAAATSELVAYNRNCTDIIDCAHNIFNRFSLATGPVITVQDFVTSAAVTVSPPAFLPIGQRTHLQVRTCNLIRFIFDHDGSNHMLASQVQCVQMYIY